MHAGLPQIAMDFPEYQKINNEFPVAVLIDELASERIAHVINQTMQDKMLLETMRRNAMKAREVYCWQNEEKNLLHFYSQLFS
jgi:hypothetical protein